MEPKHFARYIHQLVIISCALLSLSIDAYQLPALGNSTAAVLPIKQEKRLGLHLYQKISEQIRVIKDPLLQDYIQTLGDRLISNANPQPFNFHFFLLPHSSVNAFTGPGGYVAVYSGLFEAVDNEAQLAAVLSHEISHATQRHISRGMERANISTLANLGALIAAAAIGVTTGDGNITTGALMSAQALNIERTLGFSRAQEQEADRVGIRLLYKSGYDPFSMPQFLSKLGAIASADRSRVAELLSTHPLTDSRVADTQNRARIFPKQRYRVDSHSFYLMRARLVVDITSRPSKALRYFRNKAQERHATQDLDALKYGEALAHMKLRHYDKARNIMQSLASAHPKMLFYKMGLAEIDAHQGRFTSALTRLKALHGWYPDYLPVVHQYAQTLLENRQGPRAIAVIDDYADQHTLPVTLLRLEAKAHAQNSDLPHAYLYQAKADVIEGRYRSAYRLAKQGMKKELNASAITQRELQNVMQQADRLNVPARR